MAVLLKSFQERFDALLDTVDEWRERDAAEASIGRETKATRAYRINCTGDVVAGDEIMFIKRIWDRVTVNSYGKKANVVVEFELVEGVVVGESYGSKRGQHTFTIKTNDDTFRIKGRNLYAVGVWRKGWKDEEERNTVADDKHSRGRVARSEQRRRKGGWY